VYLYPREASPIDGWAAKSLACWRGDGSIARIVRSLLILIAAAALLACGSTQPAQTATSQPIPPTDAPPTDGPPPEQLDKAAIVAGMSRIAPRVRACFDQYRVIGVWTATLTIVNSGQVSKVHVAGPHLETANCIGNAVAGAIFPPFTGAPLTISYPYVIR
jgi:hypothetical protein